MKLGEGKADLMEELDDMKLKFRAAAHVAEKWRNQSLHVLEILMNVRTMSLSPLRESGQCGKQSGVISKGIE